MLFDPGSEIKLRSGPGGVRFLFISGRPIRESIAWYGPIVMNSEEELKMAFEQYEKGHFSITASQRNRNFRLQLSGDLSKDNAVRKGTAPQPAGSVDASGNFSGRIETGYYLSVKIENPGCAVYGDSAHGIVNFGIKAHSVKGRLFNFRCSRKKGFTEICIPAGPDILIEFFNSIFYGQMIHAVIPAE